MWTWRCSKIAHLFINQNDKMDYILCGRYFSADILPKHLFIESGNNKLKSRVLPRLHTKCTSKVTFREVLTMLAVFDCIFIRFDCASVLPQIVCFCHVCCWYCAFFSILQHCVDNIWSSTIVRLLEGDSVFLPEILITRKTLPSALGQSVNVNQLTLGLFFTQTWIHPHLFPYLLPFIQVACIIRKAFARILFCFRSRWTGPSGLQCP